MHYTAEDLEKARNEGREAGRKEAFEHVNSHLGFLNKDKEGVLENIKNEKDFTVHTMAAYQNSADQNDEMEKRNEENPPAVEPGDKDEKNELKNSSSALEGMAKNAGLEV